MKWIKKGVLRVSNDLTLKYGDDIPKKGITAGQLKRFKDLGYIGDIIENISEHPEVRALKMQLTRRDKRVEELEVEIAELKAVIGNKNSSEKSDTGKEK